jgi:hypothetical protein
MINRLADQIIKIFQVQSALAKKEALVAPSDVLLPVNPQSHI